MSSPIGLGNILSELGPHFAEAAEVYGAEDRFASENYKALRQGRVLSALMPSEFGGGSAMPTCARSRALSPAFARRRRSAALCCRNDVTC